MLSQCSLLRGADKSLARPTSQSHRTEWLVSLEANLLLRSNNICLLQTLRTFRGMKGNLMFNFQVRIINSG